VALVLEGEDFLIAAHRQTSLAVSPPLRACASLPSAFIRSPRRPRRSPASLRSDLRELDHLRPPLGLLNDELVEFRRRHRQNRAAQVLEPPLDLRISERGIDLAVEQIDDFAGGAGRRANS